jgi:type II secretory pathway pseudopilin PulG
MPQSSGGARVESTVSRGLLGLVVVLMIVGTGAGLAVSGLSGGTAAPGGVTGVPRSGLPGGVSSAAGPDRGALAASCNADAKSVETAMQDYQAAHGSYPANLSQLVPDWLRALPPTSHYTIAVDQSGRVGVYPPGAMVNGSVPDGNDYDLHPELCDSVPR